MKTPLFFPDVRLRCFDEEEMDRPDADEQKLYRTIRQFDVINRLFSAAVPLFKKKLLPQMLADRNRVWTILDFGSGGGDIDRALVRLCRRQGLKVRITALDLDPRVLPWARELCRDYPEITPVQGSVFELDKWGDFDFVVSNHTLHHFDWEQVRRCVETALAHSRRGILINDLRRSSWAYLGYTIFTGLFLRRSLAFEDGRLSIRRGFTKAELEDHLAPLLSQLEIGTCEPARVWLATKDFSWRAKPG